MFGGFRQFISADKRQALAPVVALCKTLHYNAPGDDLAAVDERPAPQVGGAQGKGLAVAGRYFFEPMSEPYARAIVAWRYPGQYNIYNIESEADVEADVQVLLDPRYAYHAVLDAEGDLVGFCCYGADAQVPGGDYSDLGALDVGLGLRPDLAGQGRGLGFLEAIMDFARARFGATRFRATIAAFNVRSRRVFEKAGYVETQRFKSKGAHPLEFVVVVKEADSAC